MKQITLAQIQESQAVVSRGIRMALAHADVTPAELATKLGKSSAATINNHARGRRMPTEGAILEYAQALGLPPAAFYLLGALDIHKISGLFVSGVPRRDDAKR